MTSTSFAPQVATLGHLKEMGYRPRSIKQEMRDNLIQMLEKEINPFDGIWGFDHTVLPSMHRAILARHNILLLGLRGQAKTRLARQMVNLLDEYLPYVEGSEIYDDPLNPVSHYAISLLAEKGEDTPIAWLHRSERYVEKLATPDVTIADIIGDVDPIKAAALKLPYSDPRVIHFGLVPRANRSIFVINELPDLQARIQVALFNILQEKDIQIRGFKIRLSLDIQFVFTANPEDYTNRGSIVTPLKDRIESQILTHYPVGIELAKRITLQEARILPEQRLRVMVPDLVHDIVEQVVLEGRRSEYVDAKSGVSARLSISAYESLIGQAERRTFINKETGTHARVADLYAIIQAIVGKLELVYEGEQEGAVNVAKLLIGKSVRNIFPAFFPNPELYAKRKEKSPYQPIAQWFSSGNYVELSINAGQREYEKALNSVPGLSQLVLSKYPDADAANRYILMELILFALVEYSLISKHEMEGDRLEFKDLMTGMFSMGPDEGAIE